MTSNVKTLFYPDAPGDGGENNSVNTGNRTKITEAKNSAGDDDKENAESVVNAQLIREGEPMRLTNLFVDKPCHVLLIGFLLLILITVVSYLVGYFDLTV